MCSRDSGVEWNQGCDLSILYSIREWDTQFENNRSRSVEDLSWVAIPNRHDGENYTAIITHPEGSKIFSAWVLICQVASKCKPRGILIKDNGLPHDAASLSLKTRAPQEWFKLALDFLSRDTDWLESTEFTTDKAETVRRLSANRQRTVTEWNGIEGKGKKGIVQKNGASFEFPSNLQTDKFKEAWGCWVKHRKEIRKPLTPTSSSQQLKMLSGLGEPMAISAIEYTIQKGWQGLAIRPDENQGYQRLKGPSPTDRAIRDLDRLL